MANGEKILGVGPTMLVAVVISGLLIAIVAGKWNEITSLGHGDLKITIGGEVKTTPESTAPYGQGPPAPPTLPAFANQSPPAKPLVAPVAQPAVLALDPYQQFIQQLLTLQMAGNLQNASTEDAGMVMLAAIRRSPEQWRALLKMLAPEERMVLVAIEPILKAMDGR